jgi:uncharacterized protein
LNVGEQKGMLQSMIEVYVLILILSVVQSLFGVGLLLFGTPLLLLMGHEYADALLYLLPASAALSWSQVRDTYHERLSGSYRARFFVYCLPALFLGMLAATRLDLKWEIKLFVTIMLALAFLLRSSDFFRKELQRFMKSNLKIALFIMGAVHGLSNMGGSILTPLVSSLYKDKNRVLAGISFDYAIMATLQLIVLLVIGNKDLTSSALIGAAISLMVRHFIGRRLFAFASEKQYQMLLNVFILANAVLLGINL